MPHPTTTVVEVAAAGLALQMAGPVLRLLFPQVRLWRAPSACLYPHLQLGVLWLGEGEQTQGLGFFPGVGPKAGSSAGQQEQALWLRGDLCTPSLLLAQIDEAGALMATQEVLMGLG